MRWVLALSLLIACHDDAWEFPLPEELPSVDEPPDAFTSFHGRAIETLEDWAFIRKPELLRMFSFYEYGFAPSGPAPAVHPRLWHDALIENGTIHFFEYEVSYGPPGTPQMYLALFVPVAPPVRRGAFLALNACGNQTVTTSTAVRVSTGWIESQCDPSRGSEAGKFPIAEITARGYSFATFHQSDVAPDNGLDRDHAEGVFSHFVVDEPAEVQWGTLRAWAWGLSRAVDALQVLTDSNAQSVIMTVGHSRRGKAALIAAAYDTRIAMAFPHQSGTGGATLTRSDLGEPVSSINLAYPHWFDTMYKGFSDEEDRLPIDQHLLLGMVAPRPVLVTNGELDEWADPPGALRSVELAKPIYTLLGGSPDDVAWQVRPGGHSLEASDWTLFMDFADEHW